jgi:hypothetical protein
MTTNVHDTLCLCAVAVDCCRVLAVGQAAGLDQAITQVAQLQQEAARVAQQLDTQQLLALLQQQQLAVQQQQVRVASAVNGCNNISV